jgi:hypothetical protein
MSVVTVPVTLRLDLQASERQVLERLVKTPWKSIALIGGSQYQSSTTFRASAVKIVTEGTSVMIRSLDVPLLDGFEGFRIHIAEDTANSTSPSSQTEVGVLDIGPSPAVFLVWRDHTYPHAKLALEPGLVVRAADALLFRKGAQEVLLEVSALPTWLDVTREGASIQECLGSSYEVELLS